MKLGIVLVVFALAGCTSHPDSPPTIGTDECPAFCARITAIGCPEGARPSCVVICRRDQSLGHASQIDVHCVDDAGTPADLEHCNIRCR